MNKEKKKDYFDEINFSRSNEMPMDNHVVLALFDLKIMNLN
jgi:hypothetical protein